MNEAGDPAGVGDVRLDKWLWAARCFKTRSSASDACAAGHVKLNGGSAKAAKAVRPGDRIEVVTPGGLRILEVAALADRRGSAAVARTLYVDHTPPPPPKAERPAVPVRDPGAGRPSKREQRLIRKLRGY
jgi:ribosome-associated heat shock protein Hsp15